MTNQPAASGLAAVAGKIFASYGTAECPRNNRQPSGDTLVMLDGATGRLLRSFKIADPGDLKVGADGKLYLVSGGTRISLVDPAEAAIATLIDGVRNARSVTADKYGNIYVGLRDPGNQVAVFDKSGKRSAPSANRADAIRRAPGTRTACASWPVSRSIRGANCG